MQLTHDAHVCARAHACACALRDVSTQIGNPDQTAGLSMQHARKSKGQKVSGAQGFSPKGAPGSKAQKHCSSKHAAKRVTAEKPKAASSSETASSDTLAAQTASNCTNCCSYLSSCGVAAAAAAAAAAADMMPAAYCAHAASSESPGGDMLDKVLAARRLPACAVAACVL
jgi:hypothetical protein